MLVIWTPGAVLVGERGRIVLGFFERQARPGARGGLR
jgi:hypothetical protein